eukprot:jgi/Chrpa1/23708/Chrysochromulina_OHIO_Genome00027833-RA
MRANSLTELDLNGKYVGVEGGMVVAGLIPVMGGLTKLSLKRNHLEEEGTKAICEALKQNKTLKELDISGGDCGNIGGSAGAKHVARMLGVNGALTKLSLAQNKLEVEGTKAICEALEQNTTLKELDISGGYEGNIGGSAGAKHVAKMLGVNGGLTSIDVRQNSIAGDGAVQLAVAVLGNLNINFFNEIPIKEMRAKELDLKGKDVGVEGGMVVAGLIPVMGALTSLELRGNQLRDKGWGAIFAAICGNKDSKILFLDVSSEDIGPAGVKLIAEALRTSVTGGPTSLNLSDSQLCGLDRHGRGTYSAEGITAIAHALRANGALTSVDLRGNQLRDEGWGAIFAAICGNKDSKIMSMDAHYENIGLVGGKLIAEALRTTVTGSLTSLELRRNQLGDKGWGAIFAAICGNKDSKIMSLDAAAESIGPAGVKLIAEALRTSVTGGLTKLSLAHNNVGEVGTKAICKALEQNTTLKELDISGDWRGSNTGGSAGAKHVAKMLCVNGGLTALNLSSNSLKDEGVNAVCEAIQSNKETKL